MPQRIRPTGKGGNAIEVDRMTMKEFRRETDRMAQAFGRKKINEIQRRNIRPMEDEMERESPSVDVGAMTGVTTRQKKQPRAPRIGIRIGVINNDPSLFPKFSAPALASVLEYGTQERFQKLKRGGFIVGKSTGAMPDKHRWLRLAWDRNVKQFVVKTEQSYRKLIER